MIRVAELTKRYERTLALDQVTLEVPEGAVFGLLGPNGAGKTTILRLVMGFAFPDSGTIDWGNLSPGRIGYLPERAFYPPRCTIHNYLHTLAALTGIKGNARKRTVDQLLERFGLGDVGGRRLSDCSRGMLQRMGVAQTLLGEPPLVLLDEPVLGLDPAAQKFMREQILALKQAGRTIVLSSHHLDEVTRVCTHIAMINKGRLVRCDTLGAILTPQVQIVILTSPMPAELCSELQALAPGITSNTQQITLAGEAIALKAQILKRLLNAGIDIRQLNDQQTTLEEVYLEATSK